MPREGNELIRRRLFGLIRNFRPIAPEISYYNFQLFVCRGFFLRWKDSPETFLFLTRWYFILYICFTFILVLSLVCLLY